MNESSCLLTRKEVENFKCEDCGNPASYDIGKCGKCLSADFARQLEIAVLDGRLDRRIAELSTFLSKIKRNLKRSRRISRKTLNVYNDLVDKLEQYYA